MLHPKGELSRLLGLKWQPVQWDNSGPFRQDATSWRNSGLTGAGRSGLGSLDQQAHPTPPPGHPPHCQSARAASLARGCAVTGGLTQASQCSTSPSSSRGRDRPSAPPKDFRLLQESRHWVARLSRPSAARPALPCCPPSTLQPHSTCRAEQFTVPHWGAFATGRTGCAEEAQQSTQGWIPAPPPVAPNGVSLSNAKKRNGRPLRGAPSLLPVPSVPRLFLFLQPESPIHQAQSLLQQPEAESCRNETKVRNTEVLTEFHGSYFGETDPGCWSKEMPGQGTGEPGVS